jgi:hypothetical protein
MKRILLSVTVSALLGLNGIALATGAESSASAGQTYQIGNETNAQATPADTANQPEQVATEDTSPQSTEAAGQATGAQ